MKQNIPKHIKMNNQDTIDVVYFITENYWELTLNSIKHLKLFYRSNSPLVITVFYIGKKPVYIGDDIIFRELESKENSYFFIRRPEVFKLMNKKFIFIDSDTIIQTCISKLYNIELNEKVLGAVPCYYMKYYRNTFDFYGPTEDLLSTYGDTLNSDSLLFFNAGVLLIDGKKWNTHNYSDRFAEIYELYKNSWYKFMDEIAFNLVLSNDNILELDMRWNYNLEDSGRRYITHCYGKPSKNKPDYYSTLNINKLK